MGEKTNVNVRMDKEIKKSAEEVLKGLGMTNVAGDQPNGVSDREEPELSDRTKIRHRFILERLQPKDSAKIDCGA